MNDLKIGTSGWSYKDWVGTFYPKTQSKTFDWLEYYSEYFNAVEVNSTYYTYINPSVVEGWINKVEDKENFLFTIKLHQNFTHIRKYSNENIKAVKINLEKLTKAERFGGLLIQFPYSFVLNKENANHIKTLVEIFSEYDKFIEVRHKSWFIERFFNFISKNRTTLCTIDQPDIGEAIGFNTLHSGESLLEGQTGSYVRLHGRNKDAWLESINNFNKGQSYEQQSARYNYLYTPGEIVELGLKIKDAMKKDKKIFIYFNNHPNGNAVVNALELINFLKGQTGVKVPETALIAYPRLSKISTN